LLIESDHDLIELYRYRGKIDKMSGHNKWSTIKHRKGAQDKKRGKIFTKLIKEITVAARIGGGDPTGNPRLRLALQTARVNNMPRDNIQRAIKKGTGDLDGVNFEELVYEGYGPDGVALLVDTLTDNANRTVMEVRTVFNKRGGNLGTQGSVAWMFEQKGSILVSKTTADFDSLFEQAAEAGAEDVIDVGESWQILTARGDLYTVCQALETARVATEEAKLARVPQTLVTIDNAAAATKILALVDAVEDLDDVQDVWANFDLPDEVAAELEAG
jgi:YebC/PmpR family DNA-binding regulatory protein